MNATKKSLWGVFFSGLAVLALCATVSPSARAEEATTTDDGAASSTISLSDTNTTSTLELGTGAATTTASSTAADPADNATSTDPAPTISILLAIEGATSTLYRGPIAVSACATSSSTLPEISGYCAILQTGLPSAWSSFGSDRFLDSVGGSANDFTNGVYWTWFADLADGQTSLNAHALSPGEYLLVTLGRMPLKISAATATPEVGSTLAVSVLAFGFDASFQSAWTPAASSSVRMDGALFETNTSGTYDFAIATTTPFTLSAVKTGFLDAPEITIAPLPAATGTAASSTEQVQASAPAVSVGGGGGGGGSIAVVHRAIDTEKAVQFLLARQLPDGSFGAPLHTDWSALALAAAAHGLSAGRTAEYLRSAHDALASATDYERRAMALMALGIDPYAGTQTNYIEKIAGYFDGAQIGDAGLVNDDIFALFPLIRAGYSPEDVVIQKSVSFILSRQKENGSWEESVDLTAAGIQALALVPATGGVSEAQAKARAYLAARQLPNGGFGGSFSTSWALQAIAALHEQSADWLNGGNNPQDHLYTLQNADGGMENLSADQHTRIWATAYAIPAGLNKPWGDILVPFAKPSALSVPATAGSEESLAAASSTGKEFSAPSSTPALAIATSTLPAASSSLAKTEEPAGVSPEKSAESPTLREPAVALALPASNGGISPPRSEPGGAPALGTASGKASPPPAAARPSLLANTVFYLKNTAVTIIKSIYSFFISFLY